MYQRLEEFLGAHQAAYEVVEHEAAITAQEQAAATHAPGRSVAKVLIVKERDGYVMAILPASAELDLDRLKGLVGHGEIRLATVEEIRAVVTDCVPGAIPPFGALYRLRSFVDRSLLLVPQVTMPAGDPASAIRMRSAEFRRLVDARPGDFAVPEALVTAGGVARPRRARRRGASTSPRRR
ncbi:MAG TPA: YbaK/EbsC family protein [Methylomirabilota bacterium]|nr:YbaK/EbsC family protein [Methylomirabilota bacterium]